MNGQLYVVPELTTTFQQWTNKKKTFLGDKIMPEVMVDNERFLVWSGGSQHLIVPSSTLRFGKARAAESTYSRSTTEKGPLNERALSAFITERQYKLGGKAGPISVENQVVEGLASQMELIDEKALADFMSDTANITHYNTLSGVNKWTDFANSDPFVDITTAVVAHNAYSPADINAAWLSKDSWLQIVNHPAFLDRIKWSKTGVMTLEDFLQLMAPYGIEKLWIGDAKINTANENQTPAYTNVWGGNFWMGYVTDTPEAQEINGGYKFRLSDERRVTRETKNNPPGNEIVNTDFYDYIALSTDVYYMIQGIV
jgi:hypothetical protein